MQHTISMIFFFFAMLFLTGTPTPLLAQHDTPTEHAHGTTPQAGANPLIEEMVTLNAVYCDVVSAVALGDRERVHKALLSMHGTMERTHEGVHAGSVTLPKNGKHIKEFIHLDRGFHEKLEALDRASQRKNQQEMLRITKQLLDNCVTCHQKFRQ